MLNLYSELLKNAQDLTLMITGLGVVYITGIILLIAVCFKFFEHFLSPQKLEKNRKHFFSTFGMTLLVLVLFNFWHASLGQFQFQNKITQYIWFSLGLFLIFAGVIWHIKSKIDIGKLWSDSIEIKSEHPLIQSGAYSLARHPMYASLLMWCLGASLVMFNWATLAITGFIFFPLMVNRAKAEEKELTEIHPDYILYRNNVKMLCPTLKGNIAIFIRILAIFPFIYFMIIGIHLPEIIFLVFIHLYLGYSLTPEKAAFSYRSKSGIMAVVWILSKFWMPAIYFLWVVIAMLIYGLKWNCPCMAVYEKYGGCPCVKLVKKCFK